MGETSMKCPLPCSLLTYVCVLCGLYLCTYMAAVCKYILPELSSNLPPLPPWGKLPRHVRPPSLQGGGLRISGSSTQVTLNDCNIYSNRAAAHSWAGGVYIHGGEGISGSPAGWTAGSARFVNCHFHSNSARLKRGATSVGAASIARRSSVSASTWRSSQRRLS